MIADICSKTRDRKIETETFHAARSRRYSASLLCEEPQREQLQYSLIFVSRKKGRRCAALEVLIAWCVIRLRPTMPWA
jgi:hypothetical protein